MPQTTASAASTDSAAALRRVRVRVRVPAAVAASGCLVLGLALQLPERTPFLDVLGSMLYVVFLGLLIMFAWPRLPAVVVSGIALAIAVGIELLQLTPIAGVVVEAVPPSRLLLGSAFDPMDVIAYLGGGVLLWGLLVVLQGHAARSARRLTPPAADAPAGRRGRRGSGRAA